MSESLVPCWWNSLGRIKRCSLRGGSVPLGVGFGVSKDLLHSHYSLCLLPKDQDISSQLPLHCRRELQPSETTAQLNASFYTQSWLWCFATAMEKKLRHRYHVFAHSHNSREVASHLPTG